MKSTLKLANKLKIGDWIAVRPGDEESSKVNGAIFCLARVVTDSDGELMSTFNLVKHGGNSDQDDMQKVKKYSMLPGMISKHQMRRGKRFV